MQNLENMDVFEILITQKMLNCPKDPFVRSALICLSLRKVHMHCKYYMYTVAIAKIADSQQIIAFYKLLFCIILSIRPISLTVEFLLQIISN